MTTGDVPQYAALLRTVYLFQGLNEAQMAHVVTKFEAVDVEEGTQVITQGEQGEAFYVIFRGKVRESKMERGRERILETLGPRDYFGEESLLFERPRPLTVTTLEPTTLLRLDRSRFYKLLDEFPSIRNNLSATAESRHLAQKENFEWLGEEEVVYLVVRKHEAFLVFSMILPVILAIASIPMLVYGFGTPLGAGFFLHQVARIGGGLMLVGSILLGIWNWIDWGNDYYIVTDQRVVWLERIMILYHSRREAPLTQVLAVNVTSSWLGQILNYGNINVRTFTGGIYMRNASHPHQFASFVEGFQVRARQRRKEAEEEAMEYELRLRLGLPVEGELPPLNSPKPWDSGNAEEGSGKKAEPRGWRDKLGTFLKIRYEQNGVITYRKHWLVLLRRTGFPLLLLLSLLALTGYITWVRIVAGRVVLSGLLWLAFFVMMYVGAFLWWLYTYLDWSNDIYRLTPDQIMDIERKPLGEEDKKTASLDSILSLEHTRNGIIQLIFNYGEVTINVGQTKFVFRGVYNPDDVHQDVADYMEARERKQREERAAQERKRMVDWLVTYRHQTNELEELKREMGLNLDEDRGITNKVDQI